MNLDKESNIINFKNGLYNIIEKKLYEHTPNFFSINQIKIDYKKDAKAVPEIDDFLNKISNYNVKRKQAILEMIGYCMTTSIKFQKAFILYGQTARNGKSTLLTIISKMIGTENISNVSFQDICTNRFAGYGIQGKILNLGSEMTNTYLKDISLFKALTGGDAVEIEKKYEDRKTILPYAKFIFCANSLPHVSDNTDGFFRRIHIIHFEKSFSNEEISKFDINKVLNDDALIYLGKLAVDAYSSMNNTFSNYEESEQEVNNYKIGGNSVLSFLNDINTIKLISKNTVLPTAQTIYNQYKEYCLMNKFNYIGRNLFYREIEKSKMVNIKMFNNQKCYIFIKNIN